MNDLDETLAILREAIGGLRWTGRIDTPALASIGVRDYGTVGPDAWRRLDKLAREANWALAWLESERNRIKAEARAEAKRETAPHA